MAAAPAPPSWEEIDPFIEAFERSYATKGRADLAGFLPESGHPHYLAVLRELVRVDIEYAWRSGAPRRAEDYLSTFPALGADPAGLSAIAFEEYRQRHRVGDHPSPAEYSQRLGIETIDWPLSLPAATAVPTRPNGCGTATLMGGAELPLTPNLHADLNRGDAEAADYLAGAAAALPEPESDFCGFQLVRELGRGAFGRVYLARQGDLAGRHVALKLSADLVDESHWLARLQHSNIVPIYSVHRAGPLQALCMPYLGSVTLADVLAALRIRSTRDKVTRWQGDKVTKTEDSQPRASSAAAASVTLSPCHLVTLSGKAYVREVLRIVARLADGLAYAHEHGILHQDLKPANVLLTDDGTPMLLDFNLAQGTRRRGNLPAAHVGGTLPYMAPEQLQAFRDGRSDPDPRSDIYALGLILYESLTLRLPSPVPRGSVKECVAQLIADRRLAPPDVRRGNKDVTPAVAAIVRRCLEGDPARRYQSARQLAEDIEHHLADLPLKHAPEPWLRERGRKWLRRHPRLAAGCVVAAAIAAIVVLGGMYAAKARRLAVAEAEETRRLFTNDLRHARFYLGGPAPDADELTEGTAVARRALARYHVLDGTAWDSLPAFTALAPDERDGLRLDIRELLLLLGRGTRLQAPAADREGGLAEARRLNELAETCAPGQEGMRAVWLQRALLLREAGREAEARDLLQRARALPLNTARDYYLAAIERMGGGDHGPARDLLRDARRLDPQDAYICYALGVCYAQLGDYRRAAYSLDASLALWPAFFAAHYQRARAHNELKEHAEAAEEFSAAIRLRPDFLAAYVDRALARMALGDYTGAEADLTHALKAGTRATRVYFIRAEVRRRAGNIPGANADRSEGLRREPCDEVSWVARGLARMNSDPKGALADFDRALKINPHYLPALEDRAAVLAERLGQTEAALASLDQAIRLTPQRGQTRAGRGVLLARLGRRDEALRDAREAERLDPRPEVLYQAAGIYALTGQKHPADRREAYRLLAAALRQGFGFDLIAIDPDLRPIHGQPEYRRLLEAARTLRGRMKDEG
jgi:serine/threonine protein kinase/tetratricopeptide (TPR) repeat protein